MEFIDLKTQQNILKEKIDYNIRKVLQEGNYILGQQVFELERKLSKYIGVKYCISCSSGTDALLMSLMVLGVGWGDEVITTPYTWVSTAEVISLIGAKPVFVDIEEDTFNINPSLIEDKITAKTKAIIPVGIYGQCADMSKIMAISERHGVPVIEDAAQCFGALHQNKKACSTSLIGCTSFFPSKPLGCYGDGGAIFTNDFGLARKLISIRNHGKEDNLHVRVGINGRLDTIQAAILLAKLEIFDDELVLRNAVAGKYNELLSGIVTPQKIREQNTSTYAQYTILCENRDKVRSFLNKNGIPCTAYYSTPLHLQPIFKSGRLPVAEYVADNCLSLPMHPYLTEQEFIVKTLIEGM